MLHRARWGEKTGEIVVEIVQDGGGWFRHRLYLVPGVLLGGLEQEAELNYRFEGADDSVNPRFNLGFTDETFNMFVGCKNLSNTH